MISVGFGGIEPEIITSNSELPMLKVLIAFLKSLSFLYIKSVKPSSLFSMPTIL